ncbi:MAG: universal stress protein [Cyclobacteriaceae bacterium]
MKIKKILVPFDFSKCAENALELALEISKRTEAQLCLLNVSLMPIPYTEVNYYIDFKSLNDLEQIMREHLYKLKQRKPELLGAETETVQMISVTDGIIDRAKAKDIDLIVMGTKGATGFNELLFGSNAAQVLRETEVPTLVVPETYTQTRFDKMAFASDYKSLENPSETSMLAELGRIFNSEIEIFNVNLTSEPISVDTAFEAAQLDDYLKEAKHSYHEISNKNAEEGILDYITSHNIDMLAMVPRKHSLIKELFKGSLTKKMALHLDIPLLVMHD